jgi:hypothetical protein
MLIRIAPAQSYLEDVQFSSLPEDFLVGIDVDVYSVRA